MRFCCSPTPASAIELFEQACLVLEIMEEGQYKRISSREVATRVDQAPAEAQTEEEKELELKVRKLRHAEAKQAAKDEEFLKQEQKLFSKFGEDAGFGTCPKVNYVFELILMIKCRFI